MENSTKVWRHDVWNVCCLSIVISLVTAHLYSVDLSAFGTDDLGQDAIHIFHWLFRVFSTYLVLDTIYLVAVPGCVPAERMLIVFHHVITFMIILLAFFWNQYSWFLSLSLTVEVNTVTIIFRRNTVKGTLAFKICDSLFLLTYVGQRLIMFPYLIYLFYNEWMRFTVEHAGGNYLNALLFAPLLQTFITSLSYLYVFRIIRKFFGYGKNKSNTD